MNKDTLIIIVLLFFLSIVITSAYLFYNSKNNEQVKNKIQRDYKPGIFSITGPNDASVNIPITLNFMSNSNDQSVNAVSLQVTFDPKVLEVIKIDTTQSFCQFYPENRFNNNLGTLSIQCGAPHPGFKGENVIASVQFLPKLITQTSLNISNESMILVSDGKGTNIFSKPVSHTLTILNNI